MALVLFFGSSIYANNNPIKSTIPGKKNVSSSKIIKIQSSDKLAIYTKFNTNIYKGLKVLYPILTNNQKLTLGIHFINPKKDLSRVVVNNWLAYNQVPPILLVRHQVQLFYSEKPKPLPATFPDKKLIEEGKISILLIENDDKVKVLKIRS